MRASKSLLSILTLAMVLSASVRAEDVILPPFGAEIPGAVSAAGNVSVAASELKMQASLFIRKNHLGNPQDVSTIHTYYRPAFYDIRNIQSAASAVQDAIGGGDAIASYESLKATFLSLNQTIRSMKNSGLKNAQQVGGAFEGVRTAFEGVRGYFISRWKNKQWVESSAVRSIEAIQYSVQRVKELLDIAVPGSEDNNVRTRVAVAQMKVVREDVRNFQDELVTAYRDPRTGDLQSKLTDIRQSVQLLQQLAYRPNVLAEAQTETNTVLEAVRQLDEAYTAELN